MKKHTLHRPVLALLAMTLVPSYAWSQAAPQGAALAANTATSADEAPVVLDPFRVDTSKDNGYKATNSTSGTRLNTPIKQLPMNLEVITSDFIQHTGATNLREAMRYSSGVVLESQSDAFGEPDVGTPQSAGANDPRGVTRAVGDSTVKLRGFIIEQVLRDGFRRQYSADWINMERVDVMRGPSALLYGVGSLGGVVNYQPKRPEQKEKYYFGTTVGTNEFYRAEFDATGPMGNSSWKPAYRVTGAVQNRGDHTDFYNEKHWIISPSFSFRPLPDTEVLIDTEFGDRKETGIGFQNIRNNVGNEGPGRGASWVSDIFDPVTSEKIGQHVDNRTFRWSGDDTYLKGPFRNTIIDITQSVGENLFIKVGAGRSVATFDSRQVANASLKAGPLDGTPQDARKFALYGTIFDTPLSKQAAHAAPSIKNNAVIQYEWVDYEKEETRDQIRADATYQLDLGKWGKHTFIGGVQYQHLESIEDQFGPGYSYGARYVADFDRYSYWNPNIYQPFTYGIQGDGRADNPRVHLYNTEKHNHDFGVFGVYQGQFLKDRVTVIGGIRRDRSDARETKRYIYETTHATDYSSRVGTEAPTATSPQIGVTVKVTDEVSIFGLYSTGVVPNYYARDGYGNMMPTTKAKNYEAGVKFDLFDGRLSGTVSAYKIKREGVPRFLWWAPSPYESQRKGYDPSKPAAQVAFYATPDALWEGIHNTPGRTVEQQTALAKQMWPQAFWSAIDFVAAAANKSDAWPTDQNPMSGAAGSNWWNGWLDTAYANTTNPGYTGDLYFPLVNYSDPEQAAFMRSIHSAPGWSGNYYYDAGQPYRFGNGSVGYGNAPNGSGAYVPMNDQARGWDVTLNIRPVDELQIVASFAHVDRSITTRTYKFVKALYWPGTPWMTSDNNYGTLDSTKTAKDVYLDVNDTTTYNQTIADYGESGDDSPRNTASLWMRYDMNKLGDSFKGWAVGLGGQWEDNRMWFTGFSGGGGNVTLIDGTRTLVKLYTPERYTFNAMVEYNFRWAGKYDTRIALNVDNFLDDTDLYGQVYASGASAKLSVGVRF